jgi:hypothetical protein
LNVYSTGALTILPGTAFTTIPGLTLTVTVPANTKTIISTTGGIATQSGSATGFSQVDVWIFVDGSPTANGSLPRLIAANTGGITGMFTYWSTTTVPPLAPGVHTISVMAKGNGGANSNATVAGDTNSVLQGELIVAFVKQ